MVSTELVCDEIYTIHEMDPRFPDIVSDIVMMTKNIYQRKSNGNIMYSENRRNCNCREHVSGLCARFNNFDFGVKTNAKLTTICQLRETSKSCLLP